MSRVNTYLNFMGDTEEAFNFYRVVFDTDYPSPMIRFKDFPSDPNTPPLSEAEANQILHVELPILAGHLLMGTDMLASMGHELRIGNNTTISLETDTKEEIDALFNALSEGSSNAMGMQDMPWGAYWGTCLDRFGVRWMFSFTETSK
ncbi:MAG: VOC family protein [Acidimicrobiales bacterium]|jgi:PhnB protein